MEIIIGLLILGAVIAIIAGRKNIARIFGAGRAQVTKAAVAAENLDPQAMLQSRIDQATERLHQARVGVEKFKGWVNRLERQVRANREDVQKLTQRVDFYTDKGDNERAKSEFVRLQNAKKELTENESQLQQANSDYQQQLNELQRANRDIQSAEEEGRRLGAKLELAQARREAASVVNAAGIAGISGELGGDLKRATETMQRQIDDANASATVTTDLGADARADAEMEDEIERSQHDKAFDEYLASKGKQAQPTA